MTNDYQNALHQGLLGGLYQDPRAYQQQEMARLQQKYIDEWRGTSAATQKPQPAEPQPNPVLLLTGDDA